MSKKTIQEGAASLDRAAAREKARKVAALKSKLADTKYNAAKRKAEGGSSADRPTPAPPVSAAVKKHSDMGKVAASVHANRQKDRKDKGPGWSTLHPSKYLKGYGDTKKKKSSVTSRIGAAVSKFSKRDGKVTASGGLLRTGKEKALDKPAKKTLGQKAKDLGLRAKWALKYKVGGAAKKVGRAAKSYGQYVKSIVASLEQEMGRPLTEQELFHLYNEILILEAQDRFDDILTD